MRRIALGCLCLSLASCGYNTWWNAPFSSGTNPNFPAGVSENMRRVSGEDVNVRALTPEPGDVWPGPIAPLPTLQDIEQQSGLQPQPEQAVPGSPQQMNTVPNVPTNPRPGSSTPPPPAMPNFPALPPMSSRPTPNPPVLPPTPNTTGPAQVYQTPGGPSVSTGGTTGYQTLSTPGGGSAIVVPNGNGTSTIIHSDGKIETVPTPK
jgi:hypothetical protein